MFASPALAERIDAAEGASVSGFTSLALARDPGCGARTFPVGGGIAVFTREHSVVNKVIGMGFGSLPDPAQLDVVEQHFAAHRSPIQAEVASLADPATHALFAARGYVPRGFENVLGHQLNHIRNVTSDDLTVRPLSAEFREQWVAAVSKGFANADVGAADGVVEQSVPEVHRWFEDVMQSEAYQAYGAFIGAVLVAGGLVRFHGGLAQFSGAATLPAHRRQGAQTALYIERLQHAASKGCDLAVVVTQPGSKSEANAVREGFELLYTRQLWVKEP